MGKQHESVNQMWNSYLLSIGCDSGSADKKYTSWYFSNVEQNANDLARLVKQGTKRATTSLYYWYQVEEEPVPKVGDLSIVTDWQGVAQCIVETKKVTIIPFIDVTEDFVKAEGEGDKSLAYWRAVHLEFFTRELEEQGKEFRDDMPVVCEEFEVVYQ